MKKTDVFILSLIFCCAHVGAAKAENVFDELKQKRNYSTGSEQTQTTTTTKSVKQLPEWKTMKREKGIAGHRKHLETMLKDPNLHPTVRQMTERQLSDLEKVEKLHADMNKRGEETSAAIKKDKEVGGLAWNQLVSSLNSGKEDKSFIGKRVSLLVTAPPSHELALAPGNTLELQSQEGINCRVVSGLNIQAKSFKFESPKIALSGTVTGINWTDKSVDLNVDGLGGAR